MQQHMQHATTNVTHNDKCTKVHGHIKTKKSGMKTQTKMPFKSIQLLDPTNEPGGGGHTKCMNQ